MVDPDRMSLSKVQKLQNETQQLRRLKNYEKYLKEWDSHEYNMHKHFKQKEIEKHGSEKKAIEHRASQLKMMLGQVEQPKLLQMLMERYRQDDLSASEKEMMLISLAKTMKNNAIDYDS